MVNIIFPGKYYCIFLLLALQNTGLQAQQISNTDTVSYTVHNYSESCPAFKNQVEPAALIQETLPVFDENTQIGKWVNIQVKKIAALDTALSLNAGIARSHQKYFNDYIERREEYEGYTLTYSLNYESSTAIGVMYNKNGYLVLCNSMYDYSGSAHGNHGSIYFCYDLRNKKLLELKDITRLDSIALQRMIEQQFRKDNELKPEDSLDSILFENKLPPNNNFYVTDKGLAFCYNPYEVAAYAFGVIDVIIPYSSIKNHLTSEFRKRMHLR